MSGSASADPGLIAGWLAARSIARGLPAPVAANGGWRVDTRSDVEHCRYVFATPDRAIADLAATIDQPRTLLKLAAQTAVLAALLPEGWRVEGETWVMTARAGPVGRAVPVGYTVTLKRVAGAIQARILTPDATIAASGYAAEMGGVFVYDRIMTHPAHRRRGLGSVVMAALGSQRQSAGSRQVLVATRDGRALYARLGWAVHAPYATAFIP